MKDQLIVKGARQHNLKNIDISLIGKYSHPVNIREWIIKYLFLFKQVRIHDFLRIHKQKWLQSIF